MTPDTRVLDKVRKLLAIAEHPNTSPAEAEAMSEKAAELMARYALDEALVAETSERRGIPERRVIQVDPPYAVPKAVLLSRVASAYRVRCVIVDAGGAGRACTLVGFASDLGVVELLYTSLLLQASSAMLAASPGQRRVRAFRHAFLLGYAASIGRRLEAANARTVEESVSTSAALVLADRKAEVDAAFTEMFPRLGSLRTTASSVSGMSAGQSAAARADLGAGRHRVGGSRTELGA